MRFFSIVWLRNVRLKALARLEIFNQNEVQKPSLDLLYVLT